MRAIPATMGIINTHETVGIIAERWELGECDPDDPKHLEQEIIKGMVFMRGTLMALYGATGRGKTTFLWTLIFAACLGLEVFGMKFVRRFKVVVVQGENEQWDIGRLRMQLLARFKITPGTPEWKQIHENLVIYKLQGVAGEGFAAKLRQICMRDKPDILVVDPMLEYLNEDSNTAHGAGNWMRRQVRPVLTEFNIGGILSHHTGKPPKLGARGWSRHTDSVYAGMGSVEFANAPRVTFTLDETDEPGLFVLRANKKSRELGWVEANGEPTEIKWVRHSKDPGSVMWSEVDIREVRLRREGKRREAEDALEECLPTGDEGLRLGDLLVAMQERGVSQRMARRLVTDGVRDKELAREMRPTGVLKQPQVWIRWQTVSGKEYEHEHADE